MSVCMYCIYLCFRYHHHKSYAYYPCICLLNSGFQHASKYTRTLKHVELFVMDFDLCFELRSSFSQWIPELRHFAPDVPIVLVGTKLGVPLITHWLSLSCVVSVKARAIEKSYLTSSMWNFCRPSRRQKFLCRSSWGHCNYYSSGKHMHANCIWYTIWTYR